MSVLRIQNTNNGPGGAGAATRVIQSEDAPEAESILLGYAPGKHYLSNGIARHGNFLQWGWSAPPSQMTTAGQDLFINSLCYIKTFDGQAPVNYR
jgi:hypothetical protein